MRSNSSSETAVYEIRVGVALNGANWADFFDDMTVMPCDNGETTIRVRIVDQSALYGLLAKLRNLALPLISVNRVEDT
jgi:hypothetical protein